MTTPSKEALAAWDALPPKFQFNKVSWCLAFDAGRKSFADGLVPVGWMTSWKRDRVRNAGCIITNDEPSMRYDCNTYEQVYALPKEE